jgi:hypothetical protein
VLHFSAGHGYLSDNVHLRETLKYTNYHEFHTSIRVIYGGQDITGNPDKGPDKGSPSKTTGGEPSQPSSTPDKPQ